MIPMKFEKEILAQQKNELTESVIYSLLAELSDSKENKNILLDIWADEVKHHGIWKSITGKEVKPSGFRIFWYVALAKIFWLTFSFEINGMMRKKCTRNIWFDCYWVSNCTRDKKRWTRAWT